MNIEDLKLELKLRIINNMIEALDKLMEVIPDSRPKFNKIIGFKGQFKQVSDDSRHGLITQEQRNVSINRIRFSLIQFIDGLEQEDLEEYNPEAEVSDFLTRIPEVERKELEVYIKFDKYLDSLPEGTKLKSQIQFNIIRFKQLNITPRWLKKQLDTLGHFSSDDISNVIDQTLVTAIEKFQTEEKLIPVDGIYGKISHARLLKKLGR